MIDEMLYSFPDKRGKCGFCGEREQGYAKQKNGVWVSACWKCVKPAIMQVAQKRRTVGLQDVPVELEPEPVEQKPIPKKWSAKEAITLYKSGKKVVDIAAYFGVTETVIKKTLKEAKVFKKCLQ